MVVFFCMSTSTLILCYVLNSGICSIQYSVVLLNNRGISTCSASQNLNLVRSYQFDDLVPPLPHFTESHEATHHPLRLQGVVETEQEA